MQAHTQLPRTTGLTKARQCAAASVATAIPVPRLLGSNSSSPSGSATHAPRQITPPASTGAPGLNAPLGSELHHPRASVQTNAATFMLDAPVVAVPVVTEPVVTEPKEQMFKEFALFQEQYEMGEMLGEGTYAKVFVARERATGHDWVVKVQRKVDGRKDRMPQIIKEVQLARVLNEARHAAQLKDVFEDARSVYCVQELCESGDLGMYMDHYGCLTESETKAIMRQLLEFLADAHDNNICYGDIKPSNFGIKGSYPSMLHLINPANPKGTLTIRALDFGCCQRYEEDLCLPDNTITGTPAYMAPEIMGGCHGKEVDMWAAGVMMYQLLSDRFPFWEADVHAMARLGAFAIRNGIAQGEVLFTAAPWVAAKAPAAAAAGDGSGAQPPAVVSEAAKDLIKRMLTRPVEERISAKEALQHPWFAQQ